MNKLRAKLTASYVSKLRRFLSSEGEAELQQAYELGRDAVANGLGVLDVAGMHQAALNQVLFAAATAQLSAQTMAAAETFFMEVLSPFEVTHRGFREANSKLQQLIELLEERNATLASTNEKLENEIAERKASEEALRQSEERFRLLISSVNDYAILMLAPDGAVASWNAGVERIKGYREDEIVGRHFSCLYLPEDVEQNKPAQELRRALRQGRYEGEGWHVRKDGSRFWANVVITPIRDGDGRLRGFARITRDMTERKKADEELKESREHYRQLFNEARVMQENLRDLSNRIRDVQEEERKRISRELHDDVGQALTAINVNLAVIKSDQMLRSPPVQKRIVESQSLLAQAADSVHRFARELRPAMLDELGLVPALRSYVKGFGERTGIKVVFQATGALDQLDGEKKTVIYRVAQESLNNVAKYARASEVEVTVQNHCDRISMEVRDNGRGFKVGPKISPNRANKHLGLLGMQERVRLVKGEFEVESTPGKGATVRMEIPAGLVSIP